MWPNEKLGDLCFEITVGYVSKMSDQYVEQGIPFLRSQDIAPGFINTENIKYISLPFHEKLRKSQLRPGDVVLVRTGYPGTAAVIPDTLTTANCADLVIARPNLRLNPRFLAYVMNSPWGKGMVRGRLVGVAQQHFNVRVAQEMMVPLPPRPIQDRIASILGAYDDLIEVSQRRVAVLEEMARRLFEEWFIHFRTAGNEGGQLPRHWRTARLGDVAEIKGGEGKITKAAFIESGYTAFSASGPDGFLPHYKCSGKAVVVSGVGAYCGRTWLARRQWTGIANTFYLVPKRDVSVEYLYLATNGIEKWPRRGAAQPFIAKTDAAGMEIVVPDNETQERFTKAADGFFTAIDLHQTQCRILKASRDLLLPRLISGQLTVNTAERELEDAA